VMLTMPMPRHPLAALCVAARAVEFPDR
jgi:hypothetical protein